MRSSADAFAGDPQIPEKVPDTFPDTFSAPRQEAAKEESVATLGISR
jgi:hypothetical protein